MNHNLLKQLFNTTWPPPNEEIQSSSCSLTNGPKNPTKRVQEQSQENGGGTCKGEEKKRKKEPASKRKAKGKGA
jgi:hypothetical protein